MSNQPQFLTDLRDGKTLVTHHVETGECQSFQWNPDSEVVLVHNFNKKHPERGAKTSVENWYMGTLQLGFRQRHAAFKTNY